MPHPAYHPDEDLSDYYLSWSMVHILCLWHFNNQEQVEASVKEFFVSKDKKWYQCGIKKLGKRYLQRV